ncbi:putative quinol monooxygenase [Oceanirhabdus seepicola]|uniref:Antibiotic biosynthesis monooxygenase n=1 Tax=Oceanirhabdus seepicola TaxID=2828781 RepID=A0A9J6P537_9CLOT|nr:antibiotic biosynthesis monooxygenase [Oceanirhabdus seepicola]MCM1991799.1 antibiotic biosynthesis monooxygenase [Oceanirhabdus seepicola]
MSKSIAFTVQFTVKPDYVEKFKESLLYVLDSMAVEDTFVSCYFHTHPDDSTKFTVYEIWNEPSMDAFFENQLKVKEYRKEYEENIPEMLESDRIITVLEPVKEWHK